MNTDRLSVSVSINGIQLPLEAMGLMRLTIISDVRYKVPVAELVVTDTYNFFKTQITLTDGVPFIISVGTSNTTAQTFNFRLFKYKSAISASGVSYLLTLYWDNPTYWSQTTTQYFQGTSSSAISYIAEACGITATVDSTSDSQVWLPLNSTWATFSRQIAAAGYLDSTSGFMLGYRLDNTLVYRNCAAFTYNDSLPIFLTGNVPSSNTLPIANYKIITPSGYLNMSGGYHGAHLTQSILDSTPAPVPLLTEIQKVKATDLISNNSNVRDILQQGRKVTVGNIDVGNTHSNYQQALYQNSRLWKTNNNQIQILTTVVSTLDLLDRVQIRILEPSVDGNTPQVNLNNSGYYFVASKTIHIGPEGIYANRFHLLRDGHNLDPERINVEQGNT